MTWQDAVKGMAVTSLAIAVNPFTFSANLGVKTGTQVAQDPAIKQAIQNAAAVPTKIGAAVASIPTKIGEGIAGAAKGVGDFALKGVWGVAAIGVVGLIGFVVVTKALGRATE